MATRYEQEAIWEMKRWQKEMQRRQGIVDMLTRGAQQRINRIIPEKVHQVITAAIKHTVNAMLKGAEFVTGKPLENASLQAREARVLDRINVYKNSSAAEGAITGAGGILLGLADFPLWLTLKMKMLCDIAMLYGYDIRDYKERLYLLYIFQLAFSGKKHRRDIYRVMEDWERYCANLPDKSHFDWRAFQQEYRDYIDIAKLLQLIPGLGAVVGFYVNHKYTKKLGNYAMNAYRMRWLNSQSLEEGQINKG